MRTAGSAMQIAADVRAGRRRALDVTEAALAQIARVDPKLHAFLEVLPDAARQAAGRVDRQAAAGEDPGPLAGVPIALKDNICTTAGHTTCGSNILRNYRSPYDATVVRRIEAAGGIIVGKTNCDEFAMGSSTENSARGPTRNPWDTERVPGGSSGGSAVAVAAGMTPLALGSDTGGSIRQPAALCGVVGFKPTYGRVSRFGLVAFGSSLDQIGPFAGSVADAALLLGVIAGADAADSTCLTAAAPDYAAALADDALRDGARGLRIGVPREYFGEGLDPAVRAAVEESISDYRRFGASVLDVSLPHTPYATAVYYLIATAEASSNLARFDGVRYGVRAGQPADLLDLYCASRSAGFGAEVKRRIMLGTFALSSGYYDAYYSKALKVRRLVQQDFVRAFETADLIVCPATPTPAFRLGEKMDDPLQMYLADIYTIAANLAGLPAIVIPCGRSGGLPIGLQLIGPALEETRVLRAARLLEREQAVTPAARGG